MRELCANYKTTICAVLVIATVVLSKIYDFDAHDVAAMAAALGLVFAADARKQK